MKQEIIYNLSHLIKVRIKDKEETQYKYSPFQKSFWGNIKEGFYFYGILSSYHYHTKQALEKEGYLIENNVVYDLPEVKLFFLGDHTHSKQFTTYEKALEWGVEQANKGINVQMQLTITK